MASVAKAKESPVASPPSQTISDIENRVSKYEFLVVDSPIIPPHLLAPLAPFILTAL